MRRVKSSKPKVKTVSRPRTRSITTVASHIKLPSNLNSLARVIHSCEQCPRLRQHCQEIARIKRRAYEDWKYWGKPVSGFGDPQARVLIIGLAPAAHGANRTGRIFTGDRSGEWLYRALHRAGFANQATSVSRDDGLELRGAYVSCIARCAPPENKPLPSEIEKCVPYLKREIELLTQVRVFVCLGGIALDGLWKVLSEFAEARGESLGRKPKFGHGIRHPLPDGRLLIGSYHPSQQNTFTGRLTEEMFDSIFSETKEFILK